MKRRRFFKIISVIGASLASTLHLLAEVKDDRVWDDDFGFDKGDTFVVKYRY